MLHKPVIHIYLAFPVKIRRNGSCQISLCAKITHYVILDTDANS